MAPCVRVVGRIDLAEQVCADLRAAGLEVRLSTAPALSALAEPEPSGDVDVVIATSLFDLHAWRRAKRRHPGRPMLAIGPREREDALRGAVGGAVGPDAYALLPGSGAELGAAVDRAAAAVGRQRRWNRADVGRHLVYWGLCAAGLAGGLGYLIAGIGALVGLPYAWNRRWSLLGGITGCAVGALLAAERIARALR